MTQFQYTPYTFPVALTAITSALLAYIIWRRRPGVGILPFFVVMLGVSLWSLAYVIQLVSTDFQTKLLATIIEYVGITSVPSASLSFSLDYTGRDKWITHRNLPLLTIEPILTLGLELTTN